MTTFLYNGLGDCVKQIVNGQTTQYTLDMNAGLTQVLDDGTNSTLYGRERLVKVYFLAGALISMGVRGR